MKKKKEPVGVLCAEIGRGLRNCPALLNNSTKEGELLQCSQAEVLLNCCCTDAAAAVMLLLH